MNTDGSHVLTGNLVLGLSGKKEDIMKGDKIPVNEKG